MGETEGCRGKGQGGGGGLLVAEEAGKDQSLFCGAVIVATDLLAPAGLKETGEAGAMFVPLEVSGGSGGGEGVGAGLLMMGEGGGGATVFTVVGGGGRGCCCCVVDRSPAGGGSLLGAATASAIQEIIVAFAFSRVSSLSLLPRFLLAQTEAIWKGPLQSGSWKTVSLFTSVSIMSV